jgi:periplasmic divalent cation tolerance protein
MITTHPATASHAMTDVLLVLCTCPDNSAERIARTLVSERLAACVNQLPGVRSVYLWQEQLQNDAEVLLLIKTTESQLPTLINRTKALHPYELPELIALPVIAGSESYLKWVRDSCITTSQDSV